MSGEGGVQTVHVATCGMCGIRTLVEKPQDTPERWSAGVHVDSVLRMGRLVSLKLACEECTNAIVSGIVKAIETIGNERAGSRDDRWIGPKPGDRPPSDLDGAD